MEIYEKYVGLVFDNRYRIEKVIGIGGMAIVFKATDLLMRKTVAVKILKDEVAADEQSVKRFTNESHAVAMLSHPNIVNIYDVSVRDNIKYIVMEFVEGITLKSYMQHREVLNLREIISYTTQILRALDHAHKKGVVHRDIKPQNIMLQKNGVIKVMDFGIAKLPNAETVTMTDKAIGTVYYISPEQASGASLDSRSDLYSLGVMMYEMATGQLPFTAETPVTVALMQVNDDPAPPREINPHIPQGLEQIILRAMEKDPAERYQSAEEMLGQLLKLRENPKIVFRDNKAKKQKQKAQTTVVRTRRSSRAMFPIIMGVTLAFLITAGVAAYYILTNLLTNSSLNNYQSCEIYDLVGAEYNEALIDWFNSSTIYSSAVSYAYDDEMPKGFIISQDPVGGEMRKVLPGKQKCQISLVVSLGERTIVLADYAVRDYRLVENELRKLGLRVKIENVENSVYEIGYVVRTDPEAGTVMKQNETVTVYVSHGSQSAQTVVPDFVGKTEAEAYILALENRIRIGRVTYEQSWSAVGTVLKQSLTAWNSVPEFETIDLTVAGGYYYTGDGNRLPVKEDYTWSPDKLIIEDPVPVVTPPAEENPAEPAEPGTETPGEETAAETPGENEQDGGSDDTGTPDDGTGWEIFDDDGESGTEDDGWFEFDFSDGGGLFVGDAGN
ncbi:MAG: protein kinase [Clostridia bacterium]|nr:protein kinase [Clostridia bacterium]